MDREGFSKRLVNFIQKTEDHAIQATNPGGYYTGLWCRDSSYILKDWFQSGRIQSILNQILVIWSHQIDWANGDRIIFGRGSPDMNFKPTVADKKVKKRFKGSLPTSIYHGRKLCEVFGKNPDIDSTALMISSTSWILSRLLAKDVYDASSASTTRRASYTPYTKQVEKILDFTIPRMHTAMEYLANRDIDGDGLLEQDHNEDWMDSIMRTGKIVYSQACWILALTNFSILLQLLNKGKGSVQKMLKLADATITAVEDKLWSEEDGAYIDVKETHHIGGPYLTLTQDISLYLVALTENTRMDSLSIHNYSSYHSNKNNLLRPEMIKRLDSKEEEEDHGKSNYDRLVSTLTAIRKRAWKEKWPLVTEVELVATGPWHLKPYQYHNHTFWPWTTGIEMLARSRFGQLKECDILLSTLASEGHPYVHCFYEWINPINDTSGGVYPFRTGISAVRIAINDILVKIGMRHYFSQDIQQQSKGEKG
ncbi:MAG: GH116 family glycosyl hydrolase [Thermoproteota archaeon]|nr:GH116 family glycosyl hydrolase [Thermoproteota archaeon]